MIVRSQRNGLPVNSVLKTCTIWHLETRLPEASTASRFTSVGISRLAFALEEKLAV